MNMIQYVTSLKNDTAMVEKVNIALEAMVGPGKNLTNFPPVMGSEDFQHLVIPLKRQVYDYFSVGIANPTDFLESKKQGQMFPFFNHNGNFIVAPCR